jgi:hypothetical protein
MRSAQQPAIQPLAPKVVRITNRPGIRNPPGSSEGLHVPLETSTGANHDGGRRWKALFVLHLCYAPPGCSHRERRARANPRALAFVLRVQHRTIPVRRSVPSRERKPVPTNTRQWAAIAPAPRVGLHACSPSREPPLFRHCLLVMIVVFKGRHRLGATLLPDTVVGRQFAKCLGHLAHV